jgi:hypothetical protein
MKLPNGDRAVVEDAKLLEYALNPHHPVGHAHAELFEKLLGITRTNYAALKDALLRAAGELNVSPGKASPFGRKYEMRVPMTGPRGSKTVMAVWFLETGNERPRLITCYVE